MGTCTGSTVPGRLLCTHRTPVCRLLITYNIRTTKEKYVTFCVTTTSCSELYWLKADLEGSDRMNHSRSGARLYRYDYSFKATGALSRKLARMLEREFVRFRK